MIGNCIRALTAILLSLFAWQLAYAHEFWMLPTAFQPQSNKQLQLNLYVGQYFEGDLVPFSAEYVATFTQYSKRGREDFTSRLPHVSRQGIALALDGGGAHVLAVDTHPNHVTLSADKFNDYLKDEGLERIIALREQDGTSAAAGRERYRRHIKTLVSVDGRSDDAILTRTGQRLEILPLDDPFQKKVGDTLAFRIVFENRPLAAALVKAWHKRDGQTVLIRIRTNAEGVIRLALPFAGVWMLSVVHIIRVNDDPDFDWESFWGNMSFTLRKAPPSTGRRLAGEASKQ